MAGHEWDWFQREELIGHISDIRVQNLQVERENVQKRTFTRWMNLHLEKCSPPLEVKDIFVDIQDGKILMALLEVLTGQSLLHEFKPSTHRIFRLNNIAKALKFLEDSNVKLVSIDAAEIADGNPSLVLGLIWNIILFLQIKELTVNLNRMASSSSLSSLPTGPDIEGTQAGTPSAEKILATSFKDQRKTIKALLSWVQHRTRKYGVAVQDFAGSWRSGLAFLAIIKSIDSNLVDMKRALERTPRENLEDAFTIAQHSLSIPRLLEPEDVMVDSPDAHSIITYVTQFLEHFPELDPDDFSEQSGDSPVEMTYVRYKDGPREEASKIITLPKNEDNGFTVELQSRPLTPPETHVYTEVNVSRDRKRNSDDQLSNRHWQSSGTTSPASKDFKFDKFSHRLESSSSNLSEKIPSNGVNGNIYGEGFENPNVVGSKGQEETFLQGGLHHDHSGKDPPNSTFNRDKEQDSDYILSNNYNKHCDSSSSFSSMSDREPSDLSYQSEGYYPSDDSLKPSPVSDDSGLVTPSNDANEEGEDFKYVMHLPKDGSERDPAKKLTVFQAYNSIEDKPNSHTEATGERPTEDTADGKVTAKISVIPHDLFYYPHYSVPIADVLHAFADSSQDGVVRSRAESDASSEALTNSTFSGDEDWEPGYTGDAIAEDECDHPGLGSEDNEEHVEHIKVVSSPPLVGSMSNGSISHPAHNSQGNSFIARTDYYEHPQTQTENPDSSNNIRGKERFSDTNSNSQDGEFHHLAKDQSEKTAAGVEAGLLDLQNNRNNQDEQPGISRKELELHQHSEPEDLKKEDPEGSKHHTSRLSHTQHSSPGVAFSVFQKDLGDMYHIGLILWLLCYLALILPELDMEKVAFFVQDN